MQTLFIMTEYSKY